MKDTLDDLETRHRGDEDDDEEHQASVRQWSAAVMLDHAQCPVGEEVQPDGNDGEQNDFHIDSACNARPQCSNEASLRALSAYNYLITR